MGAGDVGMKTNLAIVVNDLSAASNLSHEALMMWLAPLKVESLGAIPIFQADNATELGYLIGFYGIENLVISHSRLIESLEGVPIEDLAYQIRSRLIVNAVNALYLPDNEDVEWNRLELALDRFEELLG